MMGRDHRSVLDEFGAFDRAIKARRGQVAHSDGSPVQAKLLGIPFIPELGAACEDEGLTWLREFILNRPWRTLEKFLGSNRGISFYDCPVLKPSEVDILFDHVRPAGVDDNFLFAERLANLRLSGVVRSAGITLLRGLISGQIVSNRDKEIFEMSDNNTGYTNPSEITGLMWQVAMANWENTRGHLSLPQLETMAKLSLQALFASVFPGSAQAYDVAEVNRGMEKVETVLSELNARMTVEKGKLLGGKP